MNHGYNRRQLMSMCFAASLAPVTRLLPKLTAQTAGKCGWLAPLCALPLLLLFLLYFSALMKKRRSGEGLGELLMRTAGGFAKPAMLFIAAALIFSAGNILRTGSHRLISTIYPAAGPWIFILAMLALGTVASLGAVKALPRSARIFSPVLVLVLLLALIFSAENVECANLFPIRGGNLAGLPVGSLSVVEIYGAILCAAAFMEDQAPLEGGRFSYCARQLTVICLLLTVFCAVIIGCYGADMTARFSHPFFSMVRDVTLFTTVERIEALVAALWVLSDFVVFSLLLTASAHILRLVFGYKPAPDEHRFTDMQNGRYLIPVSAVLSGAAAALIPASEHGLLAVSQYAVPAANLAVIFVILPLCLAASHRR